MDATNRTSGVKEPRYWGMPDALWERIQSLLAPRPPHPLGCHRPRVDDRRAMDAIVFVLRTGCQWNALRATGICSSSSAYRRFQEWTAAGVFEQPWALGLQEYDELREIQWAYQAMDGAMTKAPLGGEKNRPQSNGPQQTGDEAQLAGGRPWGAPGRQRRRREPRGLPIAARDAGSGATGWQG
jgi:transposase